jgi:co-chaperonin GroES (HSP10)
MIKAKGPWVILDLEESDRYGSIIMPAKTGPDLEIDGVATVRDCGAGYYEYKENWYPMPVSVGDRVVFRSFLKHAAVLDYGDNSCAIHVKDVLGVLEGEQAGLQPASPFEG